MQLAREFAQDYGLTLPDGYYTVEHNHEQTSLYESVKASETGISKADHKERVTDLWRTSDSPKAFVAALEDSGYMLATGKRPYVLVDSFGKMHALPRLIDDQSVRTKDVEAYLRADFPVESLSTVEEARAVDKQLEESRERIELSRKLEEQREILARDQEERRTKLRAEIDNQKALHEKEASRLGDIWGDRLYAHDLNVAQANMEVEFKRAANAPSGLAGFLSRITGMDKVRQKLHAYQDQKRELAATKERQGIEARREEERARQEHKHSLQMMEMNRRERALEQSFEREQRSIERAQMREQVQFHRHGYEHMPSVQLALKPPGRQAVPAKAKLRYYAPTVKDPNVKARGLTHGSSAVSKEAEPLRETFAQASRPWYETVSDDGHFEVPAKEVEKTDINKSDDDSGTSYNQERGNGRRRK